MLQRLLLLIFLMCTSIYSARATHIVGGEFEMQHISGYNYKLTLNLYFDVVNGSTGAKDPYISVNIFSKATNRNIGRATLNLSNTTAVPYTNIDCTVGELRTDKRIYSSNIYLDPNIYNDPAGYYITWERCCRNRTINNIVRPEDAAQVFYMEFPPVVKSGQFFQNSSPILFPPLSDYACVGELFYFEFNGTDPDGDSLVYDMVTPMNGFTSSNMPAYYNLNYYPPVYLMEPLPAPYPLIQWLPGYNTSSQIQGSPPINIEKQTGLLTMRPAQKGLFVFGIRVQEYRNGMKIGEVRRDFQVLVLDCPRNQTPKVVAQVKGKKNLYEEGQVLRINSSDTERCLDVLFTDPDMSEFVELRARPVNFSAGTYTFTGTTKGRINQGATQDTLSATICFDECFDTEGKVYMMDFIVKDDGCSLPRQDTVRVSFVVEPLPDAPPAVSLSTNKRVFEVREGDQLSFDVLGLDPDEDVVFLSAQGRDFDIGTEQIKFENKSAAGEVSSPFTWDITCETLKKESYTLDFVVRSTVCNKEVTRTESIEIRPISNNNEPTLSSDQEVTTIELEVGKPFTANIFGRDADQDMLTLKASGEGYALEQYGMQFTSTNGAGAADGLFTWTPTCEAFQGKNLRVKYTLVEDACDSSPDKELTLEFVLKAPNNAPTLTSDQTTYTFDLKLNDAFEANFDGLDLDLDNLIMSAEGDGFNLADYGMQFTAANGAGEAKGKFTWIASCPATERESVRVNFTLQEDACDPKPQRLTLEFRVEAPKVADYVPANIFTPNGDGKNDYFHIPGLPPEFCTATFTSIRVFNRWGREVYRSNDSSFQWDGKDVNDGVYFYVIDYGTTSYRGSVTIVR
ncbi:gliding motility-associated C-terminal domain-containing protein [Pontibacter anaerobius]|uniref:Gliding motility-associated C-terminal domain-containing protein n=1 Tax=Pontibacter anaerobius TaxID=2993940 RepID=A0ABT3RJL9_9BACT|nr:gliding motility-associated C-terminal domain-containing protein [Pontibacter anaerobius]MCX2741807.1 gliding motility-associated C-terminal domain-containing protein [Pontibacter anaerobius]